ncbi:ferrochelatase [Comamonas sp. NLF-1-9]|uniref:ferrochelatase n=1 Tax=Comamonas sp. NLF-1-9 TaxID=2853163 RepID=UPI001C452DEE|nr:ferrochelatase [Comamonas sp. NLF-1-9]QXL85392.1 ferrochelatase [Comamonas sp. NLF-1-9]
MADNAPATAVLLCNLGTPEAPTAAALRRYLAEFLSDPRVVEIPRAAWWPILHGIVLRTRPAKSAAKYRSIWTAEGSPLLVWTQKQALMLQGWLAQAGLPATVLPAMRYGQPAIAAQLQALMAQGVQRVLVLPLYPQYSSTTTASLVDALTTWTRRTRALPELRLVNSYHDHPDYIGALAQSVRQHWQREGGRADKLLVSFHGIPERNVRLGDPYAEQCRATTELLARELQLKSGDYQLSFQSRFGRARWLQPYTEPTAIALARSGTRSLDVICPGFTSDCLETLEEVNQEVRDAFLKAGGQSFRYIPCLNDSHAWISALSRIAQQHLAGWPVADKNINKIAV